MNDLKFTELQSMNEARVEFWVTKKEALRKCGEFLAVYQQSVHDYVGLECFQIFNAEKVLRFGKW